MNTVGLKLGENVGWKCWVKNYVIFLGKMLGTKLGGNGWKVGYKMLGENLGRMLGEKLGENVRWKYWL